jgi:hypothetical protein
MLQTKSAYSQEELQELARELIDAAEIYAVSSQHHIKYISMVNKSLKPYGFYFHSPDNLTWEIRQTEQ